MKIEKRMNFLNDENIQEALSEIIRPYNQLSHMQ
jgi:hypothetical protein